MMEDPSTKLLKLLSEHDSSLWKRSLFLEEHTSTNQLARDFGDAGEPAGMIIWADCQTSGRGRNGHTWHSPKNCNLYFSMLLRPPVPAQSVPQLAIIAAIAVKEAICQMYPQIDIGIKWPNDLLAAGKKLCGILCEMSAMDTEVNYAVVGIGLNVLCRDFPEELRERATSLALETGCTPDRTTVLASILTAFERKYSDWLSCVSLAPFIQTWNASSVLNGKLVQVEQGNKVITGIAMGISDEGHLLLKNQDGICNVISGEAHIRNWSKDEN